MRFGLKGMDLEQWFFILGMALGVALVPRLARAQEAEEYPEYWEEQAEKLTFGDSVNTMYWKKYNFVDFGGGPWKMFDNWDEDIAIKFGKPSFLDTLIDTTYVTALKIYMLPVSINALKEPVLIDIYRDFIFSDGQHKKGIDWLTNYAGVNYGKVLYEKLNKLRLKPNPRDGCPSDVAVVGLSREIKRILPIIVAQTTLQGKNIAHLEPFFKGPFSINYGRTSYEIDNLDLKEEYYKIKIEP